MRSTKNTGGRIKILIISLSILILIIDRYYWAQISQWREDQATNIWLGYTHGLINIPVGLMSSEGIPNPNGMVILGYFLSFLPSLLMVSLFLGICQIILIILISSNSRKQNWMQFLLTAIPSLSFVVLRSTSIEFWNQYLLTFINLLFLLLALKYLEKPSLWFIPPITVLICLAPSIYLAGIVNSIVIALLTIGIIFYKQPPTKFIALVSTISILIISSSIQLTWLPYIQNFNARYLMEYSNKAHGIFTTITTTWVSILGFPVYTILQWANLANFNQAMKHADANILSTNTNTMLMLVTWTYLIQGLFAFLVFTYRIISRKTLTSRVALKCDKSVAQIVCLSTLFIILSYIFSTWLGGPIWIKGARPDQTVQFLPMSLFVIFLSPTLITLDSKARKIVFLISRISLTLFGASNLLCGFMIIRDHLEYSGNVLTEADVPLLQKMQVVDFIAKDWKAYSNSNIIPVEYRLGGSKWDWIPEFGQSLLPWYPDAVFTEGRAFDYILKHEYKLINKYEGMQLRPFGTDRYLVTYGFEEEPKIPDKGITHYILGRLRVSIMEK